MRQLGMRSLFLLLGSLVWSSCAKRYIQVFETQAETMVKAGDQWVFENDTVRIRYSFWGEGGVMSFAIYNKTSHPLFVDWKNSSLVLNDYRLAYWSDETRTAEVTRLAMHTSSAAKSSKSASINLKSDQRMADYGYLLRSSSETKGTATTNSQATMTSSTYGTAVTEGVIVKDERITSIPPNAYVCMQKYVLLQNPLDLETANTVKEVEARSDSPSKSTEVLRQTFQKNVSPLRFRNFLAFSVTEEMKGSFHVDNTFWLSEAREMDYRHFRGKYEGRDPANKPIYAKPFKGRSAFYWHLGEE